MPRTTTVECPGCPPLRALTFDVLGLIKVTEARSKEGGIPKVVERWGDPESSKYVLAASLVDRKSDPLLGVARKNGLIEVLNPLNGVVRVAITGTSDDLEPADDAVVGLHLFAKEKLESTPRSCTVLTCSSKGNASMRSIQASNSCENSACIGPSKTWKVSGSGTITCSKVDQSENYALFGGKGIEVNMWDLDQCSKIWTAKSPPKNNLGIFTPTSFTSATFLSKDDHRKFVAGTNQHQVRVYDISAQRKPVFAFDFRETPIKALAEDINGYTIYLGNGSGDLASVDIRTGKLLGCFIGKCAGSIRSIARHPEFPVIASCGLDSYLRFWDVNTRQLLSAVFLKQHLTGVVFDSNFMDEEVGKTAADSVPREDEVETRMEDAEVQLPVKRKKGSEEDRGATEENEGRQKTASVDKNRSKKKASKKSDQNGKLKSKKSRKSSGSEVLGDGDD